MVAFMLELQHALQAIGQSWARAGLWSVWGKARVGGGIGQGMEMPWWVRVGVELEQGPVSQVGGILS